ncbi:MAG: hypothetical protein PHS18_08915 [Sphaerochaetaceae bacterium]|nr:hypothetical protein [Sphaerochaetaceae bacterium]
MNIFKKDRKPRIAYREQRNGVRKYYVEVWACYESGCIWSQDSKETEDIKEAEKMLREISDKEIVNYGILTN